MVRIEQKPFNSHTNILTHRRAAQTAFRRQAHQFCPDVLMPVCLYGAGNLNGTALSRRLGCSWLLLFGERARSQPARWTVTVAEMHAAACWASARPLPCVPTRTNLARCVEKQNLRPVHVLANVKANHQLSGPPRHYEPLLSSPPSHWPFDFSLPVGKFLFFLFF